MISPVPEWLKEIWTKYIWPLILEFQQKYPDTFEAVLILGDLFISFLYVLIFRIEYSLKELGEKIIEIIEKIFGNFFHFLNTTKLFIFEIKYRFYFFR